MGSFWKSLPLHLTALQVGLMLSSSIWASRQSKTWVNGNSLGGAIGSRSFPISRSKKIEMHRVGSLRLGCRWPRSSRSRVHYTTERELFFEPRAQRFGGFGVESRCACQYSPRTRPWTVAVWAGSLCIVPATARMEPTFRETETE